MNKQKQDWESRFDDKFQRFYEGGSGGIVNDDTNTWYGLEDVKDFISSERQRLIEEVRELVDGMRKNTTLSHACLQSWGGCDCNDNKNYNQALDDLLQELNKLKGINE